MTHKQILEDALKRIGVGFKSTDNRVLLEEGCAKVDTLGCFMYCSFEFDDAGSITTVDIGE